MEICSDEDIFSDSNSPLECGIRKRSQTWSFSKPSTSTYKNGNELSIEDIYKELKQSADEFLNKSQSQIMPQYEDLSDIEEDHQMLNSPPTTFYGSKEDIHKNIMNLAEHCDFSSYHSIIEEAINSSPTKMLTLNQIYRWIETNIAYFKKLSDANKSKGWKNSIRHNLSLHKQFYRIIKDGRESYWACDMSRVKHDSKHKKFHNHYLTTNFRPRSSTEPVMIKPILSKNMRTPNEENVENVINFIPVSPLVLDPTKQTSLENLLKTPATIFKERFTNNQPHYNSLNADINALKQMDINRQSSMDSDNGSTVNSASLSPTNTMFKYNIFNSTPNLMPAGHPPMNLDIQAIVEHEKRVQDCFGV